MSKTEKLLGSATDLAAWLGVSERRIEQLANENIAVRIARGVYDIRASVDGYIKLLKKNATAQGSEELLKERVLLTREKRRQAEIETALLEGTVGDMGLLLELWADRFGKTKTKLLGIPTAQADILASETNPNAIREALEISIKESLNESASINQSELIRGYIERHGADSGTASETDAEPVV